MSDHLKFHFPTTGASVNRRAIFLAIDDHSLPLRNNVALHLAKPQVRPEPEREQSARPQECAKAQAQPCRRK